jgi:hypothetical protein
MVGVRPRQDFAPSSRRLAAPRLTLGLQGDIARPLEALQTSVHKRAIVAARGTRWRERSNENHIVRPKFIPALDGMALAWLRIIRS